MNRALVVIGSGGNNGCCLTHFGNRFHDVLKRALRT
jgi:hypothetical protein